MKQVECLKVILRCANLKKKNQRFIWIYMNVVTISISIVHFNLFMVASKCEMFRICMGERLRLRSIPCCSLFVPCTMRKSFALVMFILHILGARMLTWTVTCISPLRSVLTTYLCNEMRRNDVNEMKLIGKTNLHISHMDALKWKECENEIKKRKSKWKLIP